MESVLEVEPLVAKLRELRGNMSAAAKHFGVVRSAVTHFARRHPEVKAVLLECRESMKDNAEDSLGKAVDKGEAWAVCFYLKTQAKDRGYIERSEIDLRDVNDTIEFELARVAGREAACHANGTPQAPHGNGDS